MDVNVPLAHLSIISLSKIRLPCMIVFRVLFRKYGIFLGRVSVQVVFPNAVLLVTVCGCHGD